MLRNAYVRQSISASRFFGAFEFTIVKTIRAHERIENTDFPTKPEFKFEKIASNICQTRRVVETRMIAAGEE